jgi:signal transduction histidine kinase/serine phosphatase RsbU (regulator of sigma subunit)
MTLFLFLIDLIVNGNIEAFSDHIYMPYICLTGVGFLYALMLSIKGKIRKAPYSNFILSGVLGFSLIYLTTGFLWYLTVSDIPDLTAEGFFFMTVVFAAALTTRFAQVHTDLEKAHGDLLVLDRMKDDFMATTSHELRTPLHGIIGMVQSLLEAPAGRELSAQQKYDVELIQKSAQRRNRLVSEILDFSRLRAEKADLFLGPIRPGEIIQSIVSLVRKTAGEKNLEISARVEPDIPDIIADRERFGQIVLNLLENAIKYTDRGRVLVTAGPHDDGILVTVRDTGRGIARDRLENIWNPYEQPESPDHSGREGSGLGLAITKYLVELHNGLIWADSIPGEGTSFHFTMPKEPAAKAMDHPGLMEIPDVRVTADPEPAEPAAPAPGDTASPRKTEEDGRKKELILVVDDDRVNIHILKRILSAQGYDILTSETGPEALAILDNHFPGLILLDLMLPGMSGYDVMTEIRNRHNEAFIPVIMLTAKNQLEDMVKGFVLGCNDYLVKPFNTRELLVRVENQLVMKNIFDTERQVRMDLDSEKKKLESSLLERSHRFSESVSRLKEWETIISQDLKLSQSFIEKLMSPGVDCDSLDIALHYDPLITIGGDLYDVHKLSDNVIRIFLADATGHGINASMNSITILTEYSMIRDRSVPPREILEHLNRRFCGELSQYGIVFTCCLADIDLEEGLLRFTSAGHPMQYCLDPDGNLLKCWPRRPIIGLFPDISYEEIKLDFPPGAELILFTDGLIEGFSGQSARQSDENRRVRDEELLRNLLVEKHGMQDTKELCSHIVGSMKGDCRKMRADDDDVTLMVVRRLK